MQIALRCFPLITDIRDFSFVNQGYDVGFAFPVLL